MLFVFIISLAAGLLVLTETGSVLAAVATWLLVGLFFIGSAASAHSKRRF
ncbi:hypothetical protein LCGC14_2572620 [marine sediment metagenome]|uniref:Uncharacterized protein n=1 Tax=marine sediment metagenome TaxID=412755 RepID=A0A0F9AH80_9ZZZZ